MGSESSVTQRKPLAIVLYVGFEPKIPFEQWILLLWGKKMKTYNLHDVWWPCITNGESESHLCCVA